MRQPTIYPLFPPREDVRVGDVYVRLDAERESPAGASGYLPIDLWVSSLDISEAGASPGPVAFPDLQTMSILGADLTGVMPVEALALAFGANWKGRHQLDVKIVTVDARELPVADLLAAAAGPEAILQRPLATDLQTWLHGGGVRWSGAPPAVSAGERESLASAPALCLDVICEVFYTREIEIGIATGVTRAAGSVAPPAEADTALAQEMNARLEKVGAETPAGGTFRFLSASTQGVSMGRTFGLPIAVGYRSVPIRVEPISGRLLAAAVPTEP